MENRRKPARFRYVSWKPVLLLLLFPVFLSCQTTRFVTYLDNKVKESSGLIYFHNTLITLNDSGDGPYLYSIDTLTGEVLRKVKVKRARNVDWEDLCLDDHYIYIGHIGNNDGDRKDLRIYRISKKKFFKKNTSSIDAEIIRIKYKEQVDFTPRRRKHNFDAEALVSIGDSLYLFTKNWANMKSYVYAIPKKPGDYELSRVDTIASMGLVTGGVYDSLTRTLLLCGYISPNPFVLKLTDIEGASFSRGKLHRYMLETSESKQIESVAWVQGNHFLLSGERDWFGNEASLYSFDISLPLNSKPADSALPLLSPNPTNGILQVQVDGPVVLTVYSIMGEKMFKTRNKSLDISKLANGVYYLHILNMKSMQDEIVSFVKE